MNTLVWFRQDLRVKNNPAIANALKQKQPIYFLYVLEEDPSIRALGGASRWWLHHSLVNLQKNLKKMGAELVCCKGEAKKILPDFVSKNQISHVFWNRLYEPYHIQRDSKIKENLIQQDVKVESSNGLLIQEPWDVANQQNQPYKVYTPFFKKCYLGKTNHFRTLCQYTTPDTLANKTKKALSIDELQLLPTKPDWSDTFPRWNPGEDGAQEKVSLFLSQAIEQYQEHRDYPSQPATSTLSAHLHFGEIDPLDIWLQAEEMLNLPNVNSQSIQVFMSQLVWREFSYHLLYHYPSLPEKSWREAFENFPWQQDAEGVEKWQKGQTGFPIVDAGMRELWATGWMHNRVRMIVASFLIKDLLVHWKEGESWFWDTLIDADLANNAASWQWVAGSGADAAPYFRIFNPTLQSSKFDASGSYIKKWIPELSKLSVKEIHEPSAHLSVQQLVKLGYCEPMLSHKIARQKALKAYQGVK